MKKLLPLALMMFALISLPLSLYAAKLIVIKGNTISYNDVGQGEPIILIHAFPADKRLWEDQEKGLQAHFRMIDLDLWGFGNSSGTTGNAVSMTQYADEVKELMDELNIHQAIIGGESMGGYIALAFLKKYPENVSGLILSGTQAIAASDADKKRYEANAEDALNNGTRDQVEAFLSKAVSPNAPEKTVKMLEKMFLSQSRNGFASALRGIAAREDTSDVLAATDVPVLILSGKLDKVIPSSQSDDMHALAKNSRLVTFPDAGHLCNVEKPNEWNNAVIGMFYY